MIDSLASTFLILSLAVGLPLVALSIALVVNRKVTWKAFVYFFSVLAVLLAIGTLVNAIIGNSHVRYDYDHDIIHHPCTWVALGLSCGAMGVGLVDLIIALAVLIKDKSMKAAMAQENQGGDNGYYQPVTNNGYVIIKKQIDGDVALFTASSNNGVGLWTSICISCASIFGVESVNYTKKMDMVLARVSNKLEEVMKEYPEFEYRDFRVVKEGNLAYTASVMGIRKKA